MNKSIKFLLQKNITFLEDNFKFLIGELSKEGRPSIDSMSIASLVFSLNDTNKTIKRFINKWEEIMSFDEETKKRAKKVEKEVEDYGRGE